MDPSSGAGPTPAVDTSATGQSTRVMIVDDHDVLASSLAHVIDTEPDLTVVAVAHDLAEARAGIAAARPDVVLLDHHLPDGDGVQAMSALRHLRPQVRIIVLTATVSDQVLVEAVQNGAAGFVPKTRSLAEVTSAIRAAAAGEAVITSDMLARLLPRLPQGKETEGSDLTEREQDVLVYLARGLTNAAIAEQMFLSVHTVRNHVANLSAKLGAHSKLEALSIAMREGLLPPR